MTGSARHAYVVGLTGGVAAGKGAVGDRFAAHGIHVYDADTAAREVVMPGQPAYAEIEFGFGHAVLNPDRTLNRRALREIVFANPVARRMLEGIVHPRVRRWLRERSARDAGPYCLLAIPLLAEHRHQYGWIDRVLLVDAPEAVQIERLMQRDGVGRGQAEAILSAQATRRQRLAIADDVIANDADAAALDAQVTALHEKYLRLAASP